MPCHGNTECDFASSPCNARVNVSCKCGSRSGDVPCYHLENLEIDDIKIPTGAWSQKTKEIPKRYLPCNGKCAQIERNRALADAFHLDVDSEGNRIYSKEAHDDVTGDGHDEIEGILEHEYPEYLLRFAQNNLEWVKGIEQIFSDILSDTIDKSSHHFVKGKSAQLSFIAGLGHQYGFKVDALDAPPNQSIMIRPKKGASIPRPLISQAAVHYKPGISNKLSLSQSNLNENSSSSSLDNRSQVNPAVNALFIESLRFGMDHRSLEILLEPLFAAPIQIHWASDDDAIVMISGPIKAGVSLPISQKKLDGEDIENLIRQVKPLAAEKFLGNGWAESVDAVWVNDQYEIVSNSHHSHMNSIGRQNSSNDDNNDHNIKKREPWKVQPKETFEAQNPYNLLNGVTDDNFVSLSQSAWDEDDDFDKPITTTTNTNIKSTSNSNSGLNLLPAQEDDDEDVPESWMSLIDS